MKMVALATVKDFFAQGTREGPTDSTDEVTAIVRNLLTTPSDFAVHCKTSNSRQYGYVQTTSYNQHISIDVEPTNSNGTRKEKLVLFISGGWRDYVDGLDQAIEVNLEDYRTSKEAVEAACKLFVSRYQKPSSQGNVQVFYDEAKNIWCWKRPNSTSFVLDALGFAYHVKTCSSVVLISGDGVVPDEHRFLSQTDKDDAVRGTHCEFVVYSGKYYFNSCLVTIYKNQIPFETVYATVPRSMAERYEFVIVNGERRYINLKRPENSLLATPIHNYSTRIEQLIPTSKMFLRAKNDLYARRDKAEVPFLGWELEACSNKSTVGTIDSAKTFKEHLPWLVMCKYDSSIQPEGFETVSVPATLDFWQESNLSSALDSMRVSPHNMRSFEHNQCGFHVHVSRSALSVLDLQKLERFVHNPDNLKFITTVAGRSSGTYQKYMPELFSNRKKWLESAPVTNATSGRRPLVENISYFGQSIEDSIRRAERQASYGREISSDMLYRLLDYISQWVSYDSLDAIQDINQNILVDRYPSLTERRFSQLCDQAVSRGTSFVTEVCGGSTDPEDHLKFYKALFEEVFCAGRPVFSKIVSKFFPDWNLEVLPDDPPEPAPSPIPSWKIGFLKSKAPVGRKHSRAASQIVKGPVGKGMMTRYDALNTTNANTVEFRMFKGTMNGTTILRYLEFVDALVRFVANTNATNEGVNYTMFVGWLKNDPFNVARYEHLVSFITENGFLSRKEIRRKTLPAVLSNDNKVDGLIAAVAAGFGLGQEAKPLGVFNTNPTDSETLTTVPDEMYGFISDEPPVSMDDYEDPTVDLPEEMEDDFGGPNCPCTSCRRERGEIE